MAEETRPAMFLPITQAQPVSDMALVVRSNRDPQQLADAISSTVRGLDAVDGTPVLDIKPVMVEFLPRGPVRQPPWSRQLMRDYWQATSDGDGAA